MVQSWYQMIVLLYDMLKYTVVQKVMYHGFYSIWYVLEK